MAIERAFLADIVEHPDEDAPRLVYADWLDDQDQPELARFIRLQIERARLAPNDPRQADLAAADYALLVRCQPALLARMGLPRQLDGVRLRWVFRRGFPQGCSPLPAASFLARADDLFTRAPIRELGLADVRSMTEQVAGCRWLSRLRGLSLLGRRRAGQTAINASRLAVLLASPHLTGLEDLNLSDNDLDNPAAGILRDWPGMPGIRRLWLGRNLLDGTGIASLAHSPVVSGLRQLSLERLHLPEQDLLLLGRSPHLQNLEELDLSGCLAHLSWRGDHVLVRLAAAGGLRQLSCLRFGHNDLGQAGIEALNAWAHLRVLDLRGSYIGEPGARALAALARANQLQELHLKDSVLNDEGLGALLEINPPLRVLDLRGNALTLFAAAGLSRWPALGHLHTLRLGSNWLRAQGVSELARSPYLGQLRRLDLSENALGNAGILELVKAPFLSRLLELTLDGNGLDDRGANWLLDSPASEGILTLAMREAQPFSARTRERLAQRQNADGGGT